MNHKLAMAYAIKRKSKSKYALNKDGSSDAAGMAYDDELVNPKYAEKDLPGKANTQPMRMAKGGSIGSIELKDSVEPQDKSAEHKELSVDHMGKQAQEHESLPEPEEPMEYASPMAEDKPAGMEGPDAKIALMINPMHIAKAIKMKRMAQGGHIDSDLQYLDEDDSYPDPNDYEFDALEKKQPKFMSSGGGVGDNLSKVASSSQARAGDAPDAANKFASAFKSEGGEITDEEIEKNQKKKQRLEGVFASMRKG